MEQKKKRTEQTVISAISAQQECSRKQRMNHLNIKMALRYVVLMLSGVLKRHQQSECWPNVMKKMDFDDNRSLVLL